MVENKNLVPGAENQIAFPEVSLMDLVCQEEAQEEAAPRQKTVSGRASVPVSVSMAPLTPAPAAQAAAPAQAPAEPSAAPDLSLDIALDLTGNSAPEPNGIAPVAAATPAPAPAPAEPGAAPDLALDIALDLTGNSAPEPNGIAPVAAATPAPSAASAEPGAAPDLALDIALDLTGNSAPEPTGIAPAAPSAPAPVAAEAAPLELSVAGMSPDMAEKMLSAHEAEVFGQAPKRQVPADGNTLLRPLTPPKEPALWQKILGNFLAVIVLIILAFFALTAHKSGGGIAFLKNPLAPWQNGTKSAESGLTDKAITSLAGRPYHLGNNVLFLAYGTVDSSINTAAAQVNVLIYDEDLKTTLYKKTVPLGKVYDAWQLKSMAESGRAEAPKNAADRAAFQAVFALNDEELLALSRKPERLKVQLK